LNKNIKEDNAFLKLYSSFPSASTTVMTTSNQCCGRNRIYFLRFRFRFRFRFQFRLLTSSGSGKAKGYGSYGSESGSCSATLPPSLFLYVSLRAKRQVQAVPVLASSGLGMTTVPIRSTVQKDGGLFSCSCFVKG
jgi:hypothetical protein